MFSTESFRAQGSRSFKQKESYVPHTSYIFRLGSARPCEHISRMSLFPSYDRRVDAWSHHKLRAVQQPKIVKTCSRLITLPYSNDLPMYELSKGSTLVKLKYDPAPNTHIVLANQRNQQHQSSDPIGCCCHLAAYNWPRANPVFRELSKRVFAVWKETGTLPVAASAF